METKESYLAIVSEGLIEKIEKLKEEIKFDKTIWEQWGVEDETDDNSILYCRKY